LKDTCLLSNIIANQEVHKTYGGVVPELASRAHQQNIVPVVDTAIKKAGITPQQISAIAFTRGPGLMGSLLVGSSFSKGMALSLNIPLIDVNHLQGHILANFIQIPGEEKETPQFPFLCLLVSGGHSQLIIIHDYLKMEIIGQTIDDAAGEAFDKCAKIMDLPYPGGPLIDKLSKEGNPDAFKFNKPRIPELDYSFSGLKTSFLYFLRDQLAVDPDFIAKNKADLCASLQKTIIEILTEKLIKAARKYKIKQVALAGGVSANSGLREAVNGLAVSEGWKVFIPEFRFTTDNAAMIAITGYYKYLRNEFTSHDVAPTARIGN
jgi:N6-L-threonylcarbamoyladenine synthase